MNHIHQEDWERFTHSLGKAMQGEPVNNKFLKSNLKGEIPMTIEEYEKEVEQINNDAHKKKRILKKTFALSNSTVKIGDIIHDHSESIKVEKIHIAIDNSRLGTNGISIPTCVYSGPRYTKSGKPFKNNEYSNIYQSNLK